MPNMDSSDTLYCKTNKRAYPRIPVVLLTPFSKAVTKSLIKEDLSGIDYVFSWLGDTDLFWL